MGWELRRFPGLMARVGQPFPTEEASGVTESCIRALRERLPWEPPTLAIHYQALKQFLRWANHPLAQERALWRVPAGAPVHRRWLTGEQLSRLYAGAHGVERVLVALEGLNGLRRVEVLRLRVKDVLLPEGCLRILGKGRHGGKWRVIPMQREVGRLLATWTRGQLEMARVVPLSRSGADAALQRAVVRSGLAGEGTKASHHDLRRTFGRLANASGMNLVALQGLFGHASPALSAHYIGLDLDELRTSLEKFGSFLGPVEGRRDGVEGRTAAARARRRTVPSRGRYAGTDPRGRPSEDPRPSAHSRAKSVEGSP